MPRIPATKPAADAVTRILGLRGVGKRFGAVQALSDINLTVGSGEAVALVGDNGAGKSTLVKIISGVYQHEGGQILLDGQIAHFGGPGDAQEAGATTVFQDLAPATTSTSSRTCSSARTEVRVAARRSRNGEPVLGSAPATLREDPLRSHPHRISLGRAAPDGRDRALAAG